MPLYMHTSCNLPPFAGKQGPATQTVTNTQQTTAQASNVTSGQIDGDGEVYTYSTDGIGRMQNISLWVRLCALVMLLDFTWISDEFSSTAQVIKDQTFPPQVTDRYIKGALLIAVERNRINQCEGVYLNMFYTLRPGSRSGNAIIPPMASNIGIGGVLSGMLRIWLSMPFYLLHGLWSSAFVKCGIVLLQYDTQDHPYGWAACTEQTTNVITVFPNSFTQTLGDTLPDLTMQVGAQSIIALYSVMGVLLHELPHSRSILGALDQKVYWPELQPAGPRYYADSADRLGQGKYRDFLDYFVAYSTRLCRFLRDQDSIFGTNRAVMNAQNWALFSSRLFSQLGYPELDFTGDFIATRLELLHHNSMFDLLRSSTAGYRSIRDLLGYDITRDNFRNTFGIDAIPHKQSSSSST
ncbi:hypothetical protein LTR70_002559 [Exophiala xenobiotica]|uniref:Uncharacterized protein n=1 Tax=Lithohypha guttulata TaxID=1690604 RepID=A0ABR0KIH2_9EURO|nr:hypothetical protein LTR24_002264 [Lithohypha guttulata]KAK5325180.1 hypothetical protein LTR70_002559 [Exophiala xenobiotica]